MAAIKVYHYSGMRVDRYEKSLVCEGVSLYLAREATDKDAKTLLRMLTSACEHGRMQAQADMRKAMGLS